LREQKSVGGVILSHFAVLWSASCVILREKIFNLPALQVEQVKSGVFEGIYEDNAWKNKPDSNQRKLYNGAINDRIN
jgi:hypothetical protein